MNLKNNTEKSDRFLHMKAQHFLSYASQKMICDALQLYDAIKHVRQNRIQHATAQSVPWTAFTTLTG